jgi:RNA polymerase sigma-70 factor, ECF subfamily
MGPLLFAVLITPVPLLFMSTSLIGTTSKLQDTSTGDIVDLESDCSCSGNAKGNGAAIRRWVRYRRFRRTLAGNVSRLRQWDVRDIGPGTDDSSGHRFVLKVVGRVFNLFGYGRIILVRMTTPDPDSRSHRIVIGRSNEIGKDERERLQRRDPEAMNAFFESHFDSVYALVFWLTGERHVAEDVTQEVFYRVCKSIAQLDVTRDIAPWLTAIAYNTCRSYWRKMKRADRAAISIDSDEKLRANLADTGSEETALKKERESIVRAAILRLPEPLRVVIVMHDYYGLTHEEIARATSVSHTATRKRYSRAIAQLSKFLGRELLR